MTTERIGTIFGNGALLVSMAALLFALWVRLG